MAQTEAFAQPALRAFPLPFPDACQWCGGLMAMSNMAVFMVGPGIVHPACVPQVREALAKQPDAYSAADLLPPARRS